ncbi:MAG: Lrp/AsnC family transcriptional regulator [Methyloceanibacter sp.]
MDTTESLLKGILATVGRTAFPPETLYKIVAPTSGSEKQVLAYNLCDGQTPQTEISKKAKLDPGNLSRAIAKWVEAGVVIRVGADQLPLHLYALGTSTAKSKKAD